jgi:hypothetical protein
MRRSGRGSPQQSDDRHDLARRAEAALKRVGVDECALHRVQLAILGDPFDGLNGLSLARDGERHARVDGSAIDEDSACTARPLVTDLLCSGESEGLAQRVEKRPPGRRSDRHRRSVHRERYVGFARTAQHDTAC